MGRVLAEDGGDASGGAIEGVVGGGGEAVIGDDVGVDNIGGGVVLKREREREREGCCASFPFHARSIFIN